MNHPSAPTPPSPPEPGPFMTVRTAVILLTAVVIGTIAGALTFLSGVPAAGAVLAGLTGAGTSVPVLRDLIG